MENENITQLTEKEHENYHFNEIIIEKLVLIIKLNFIIKGISHIKNGHAILRIKARNSHAKITNNVIYFIFIIFTCKITVLF